MDSSGTSDPYVMVFANKELVSLYFILFLIFYDNHFIILKFKI